MALLGLCVRVDCSLSASCFLCVCLCLCLCLCLCVCVCVCVCCHLSGTTTRVLTCSAWVWLWARQCWLGCPALATSWCPTQLQVRVLWWQLRRPAGVMSPPPAAPVHDERYCGGTVVLWYCGTVVLWYCGTVVLWYCGTVVLWYWYCGAVPGLTKGLFWG